MKTIFIDCNPQLGAVWQRVYRAGRSGGDDQHHAVREERAAARHRRLRHRHRRSQLHADRPGPAVQEPQAHRVPRHRRGELHERRRARSGRRQGPHHQGLRRHRGRRADHRADDGGLPRSRAHGPQHPRRHLGAARRRAAVRQDARHHRARRHRRRGGAHRQGHGHAGDRLEPHQARRRQRADWSSSTICCNAPTSSRSISRSTTRRAASSTRRASRG